MNLNWLIGFVEGEGSFGLQFRVRYNIVRVGATFQLSQAEKEVLEKIRTLLSSHDIMSYVNKDTGGNYILHVSAIPNLLKLASLLESLEWHTKKYVSFSKWKNALNLLSESSCSVTHKAFNQLSMKDLLRFAKVAQGINTVTKRPRVWTSEFIERNCFSKDGKVMLVRSRGY